MKKKVCMVVPSFSAKGGITAVVSGYKGSELERDYEIHYIETYSEVNKIMKLLKAGGAYIKFMWQLITWKPDLVHIHSSFGASFYRKLPFIYLASWRHIPVINHIHGSAFDKLYTDSNRWIKKMILHAFNKCSKIIVLSTEWKQRYEKLIDIDKIAVIENYSILREVPEDRENREEKQVLFLGFLSEAKGCFDIPEIVKEVVKEFPQITFVLGGAGTERDIKKIKELIKANKVEKYIAMPGWVRGIEKERLLKNSDIFLLPSYNEAMPMSILEAMGYGLPIISTDVGGIPQLVENGENGFRLKPGDISGFSKSIIKLLKDQELYKEMSRKSVKMIKDRYSIEEHLKKIEKLYREVLS